MKKIFTASVLVISGAFFMNANSATAVGNFNVGVALTAQCQINSTNPAGAATVADIPIAYTSFQTAAVNANTSFNVRCTNTLPFSMALSAGPGSASGISYFLSIGTAATTAITVDSLSLASQTGTGSNVAYVISATAPASQAGTTLSNVTSTVNSARTVTITY